MLPIIDTMYPVSGLTFRSDAAIRPPLNSNIGKIDIMNTINSLPNFNAVKPLNNFIISLRVLYHISYDNI